MTGSDALGIIILSVFFSGFAFAMVGSASKISSIATAIVDWWQGR